MRKRTMMIVFAIALLALASSCVSDKFDYRDQYTGRFKVTGTWESTSLPSDVGEVQVESKATVDFAEAQEQVRIAVPNLGILMIAIIDQDGKLTLESGPSLGRFTDKDHFDIAWSGMVPTGEWNEWVLHGKR